MRKKIIIAVYMGMVLAVALLCIRLMGDANVGIDNEPEADVRGDSNVLAGAMKTGVILFAVLFAVFMMAGCGTGKDAAFIENSRMDESEKMAEGLTPTSLSVDDRHDNLETDKGIIAEQILDGADGAIHYSYYLPEQ